MLEDNSALSSAIAFNSSCSNDGNNSLGSTKRQRSDSLISVSSPGKIILHGEHSVVYGKLAVAASLGLRTKLTLVEGSDHDQPNTIKIELPALNLIHTYNLNDVQSNLLDKPLPLTKSSSNYNWEKPELINHEELLHLIETFVDKTAGSYPLNTHQKLSLCSLFYLFTAIFGAVDISIKPFTVKLETDLTISSGSGSSASFAVTIAAAFIQYIRIKTLEAQMKDISKRGYKSARILSTDLNSLDERELELVSKWAYAAEKIIHGTPSGIDNTICTYGSVVEFRKGAGAKLIQLCEFKLLLVNTKVKRDTQQLVRHAATLRERHPQVVEPILTAMDEISQSAIECLKQLNHFNTSSESDKSQVELEMQQYYNKLGELTDMNQHLLQALGVSHPMLDKICAIFKTAGLSGKLTGAGGGGYAIALVPSYFSKEVVDKLIQEFNSHGFEAILTNLGGPGVTIH